eukprot:2337432-Rhodomonas_salina.1
MHFSCIAFPRVCCASQPSRSLTSHPLSPLFSPLFSANRRVHGPNRRQRQASHAYLPPRLPPGPQDLASKVLRAPELSTLDPRP